MPETSFLASLLDHLPAILPASYLRVQDGIWSGGTMSHGARPPHVLERGAGLAE